MTGTTYPGSILSGQTSLAMTPRDWKPDGTGKGIIACHGHGATSLQFLPAPGGVGESAAAVADLGFAVLSGDDGGGTAFGNDASMTALTDLYNYLQTGPTKTRNGKVGILAWSMGAIVALNWMKRNPTKVACAWLWAPLTDLDWAQANAAYTSEVNAAYGGNYAANSVGHKVHDEPATFRGLCPITIAHATDDTTVPFSQSQAFVAAVNDPKVKLYSQNLLGNHTGLFGNVPVSDILQFFWSNVT